MTGSGATEHHAADPRMDEVISDYLRGEIDADELDLYLDVKVRPGVIHRLVSQGVYDVWAARQAVILTYGAGLIPPLWAPPSDGSIMFLGRPL